MTIHKIDGAGNPHSPVLVIGSGFHRWLDAGGGDVLSSWSTLLREIATELMITPVAHPQSSCRSMSLVWEEVLLRMVHEGYSRPCRKNGRTWVAPHSRPVSEAEVHARRAAKAVLDRAQEKPIDEWGRSRIFCQLPVSDVISLNFDVAWANTNKTQFSWRYRPEHTIRKTAKITNDEFKRLYWYLKLPEGPRVWFPNGTTLKGGPNIRLGLRDFGFQMHALAQAFSAFKAWETQVLGGVNQARTQEGYSMLLSHLATGSGLHFPEANHWVTRFIMQPLYILGAGLSSEEQGLWWLLVQRARNLARIGVPNEVYILLNSATTSTEDRQWWSRKTEIINPIWCDDWDSGWRAVIQRIRNPGNGVLARAAH